MPSLPGVNHKAAVRALQKAGFWVAREGKHIVMTNGSRIAWSRGHSLEEEAEEMLKWAVREMVRTERQKLLQKIGSFHANLGNPTLSSSADLIREDRDSR